MTNDELSQGIRVFCLDWGKVRETVTVKLESPPQFILYQKTKASCCYQLGLCHD